MILCYAPHDVTFRQRLRRHGFVGGRGRPRPAQDVQAAAPYILRWAASVCAMGRFSEPAHVADARASF